MIVYKLASYRPPAFRPPRMCLGQSAGTVRYTGLGLSLIMTTLGAAGAWVGIHTGVKEKGWLSAAGWTMGVVGGLFGLISFLGAAQMAFLSDAQIEEAIQANKKAQTPSTVPV